MDGRSEMVIYSWYDLPREEQRTVLRLARKGQRHPDPKIARVAEEWAREKLGLDSGKGGSIATIIIGGLLGDGASVAVAVRDRRAAKRIWRVRASTS
jgi:hypothetical protein